VTAVLVMEDGSGRPELEPLLGPRLASELQAELREQARALAGRVAQGAFHTAQSGARLSDAVGRVYAEGEGVPLLVVWPELVRLDDRHAAGALEDLQSGADVVFGPVVDGGLYLLGLRKPAPDLLERLDVALANGDPGALGLAAASELGLEIGLLRVERALRTASDLEAALADPGTPENVRRILSEARAGR
jgi:glycosyltransferase A (GT-A) superfamily protein (DUF2064 family)